MGQQRGNTHLQAKTMSYQQREFLQLILGLAPHCPLLIFWTYQVNIKTLIHLGARPLQTQEPFPPVFVSVFAVVSFLVAASDASGDASPFQVLNNQLSQPVVSRDGIIYHHCDER
jgi:hypothetical protein